MPRAYYPRCRNPAGCFTGGANVHFPSPVCPISDSPSITPFTISMTAGTQTDLWQSPEGPSLVLCLPADLVLAGKKPNCRRIAIDFFACSTIISLFVLYLLDNGIRHLHLFSLIFTGRTGGPLCVDCTTNINIASDDGCEGVTPCLDY